MSYDKITRPKMNQKVRQRAEAIINGSVVKNRRKALGLTQVELAIMAATSPRLVAMIERNQSIDPATSVTLRLARALSVTVEALCAGARPYTSRVSPPHDTALEAMNSVESDATA